MTKYVRRRVVDPVPLDIRQASRHDGATGVGTPGTGVGEEGDPSFALSVSGATPAVFYRKAQKAHHPEDCERWEPDGITATLDAEGHAARTASVVYTPEVASTFTAGIAASPGVSVPGRRNEDDHNLIAMAIDGRTGQPDAITHTLTANGDTSRTSAQRTGTVFSTITQPLAECGCCPLDPTPDSARYRAMGNAVTVSTLDYVAWMISQTVDWGHEEAPAA